MKLSVLTTILLLICFFGCNRNNHQEFILAIGKYRLTEEEFLSKRENKNYKHLDINTLNQKLTEEGRILAFALDHKYDTIGSLNKLLEYAARAYAARVEGFVWNKKVKPKLQVTEADIKAAYFKRSQELTIDVIQIQGKDELKTFLAEGKNFNSLKAKALSDKNLKNFTMPVRFPYSPLSIYVSGVENAKAGEVFGPAETEEGYIVARIAAVKSASQNTYQQEKEQIKRELISTLTRKYAWESKKQILSKATPEINDSALRELATNFDATKQSWPGVDPRLIVMNYTLEGKRVAYHAADFEEFVKNEPVFFGSLSNPDDLRQMLRAFIIEQYLFAEAQRLNIQSDKDYQLFAKSYQHKIFLEHFKRSQIHPKISIKPHELEDYYRKHNGKFRGFESATLSIYKFDNFQRALQGRMLLSRKAQNMTNPGKTYAEVSSVPLPEATVEEVKLNDAKIDPNLVKAVLNLQPGQISVPIKLNGAYMLLCLSSKKGITTIPFTYVKEHIMQVLHAEQEKQLNAKAAETLKARYAIEKNAIKKYLSKI